MHSSIPVASAAAFNKFPAQVPLAGKSIRILGHSPAPILEGENWRSGVLGIEAPLPDGYPPPTPAGCIEIKTYPSVRRAEFDSQNMPAKGFYGSSSAFFPLF